MEGDVELQGKLVVRLLRGVGVKDFSALMRSAVRALSISFRAASSLLVASPAPCILAARFSSLVSRD